MIAAGILALTESNRRRVNRLTTMILGNGERVRDLLGTRCPVTGEMQLAGCSGEHFAGIRLCMCGR